MDLEKLQGVWASGLATITITGDRFTTSQMGSEYTGRIELNESAVPKALTLHFETGPEAGNTNYGIYEFVESGWRFCLDMHGKPAPKRFAAALKKGVALQTMVRRQHPARPAGGQPVADLQGEWAMLSCVRAGDPLPASFARTGRRSITGDQSVLRFGSQVFMQGILTSDGPGTLRLELSTGEAPQLGIFNLSGAQLKTCMGASGNGRPAAFVSTSEGGETLATWKRLAPPGGN
ncbi:MAG: hypothetical protein JNM66_34120 [Bryobacterales bacterium]|nr:hypothetical protein [Bryobacterales bacterium]